MKISVETNIDATYLQKKLNIIRLVYDKPVYLTKDRDHIIVSRQYYNNICSFMQENLNRNAREAFWQNKIASFNNFFILENRMYHPAKDCFKSIFNLKHVAKSLEMINFSFQKNIGQFCSLCSNRFNCLDKMKHEVSKVDNSYKSKRISQRNLYMASISTFDIIYNFFIQGHKYSVEKFEFTESRGGRAQDFYEYISNIIDLGFNISKYGESDYIAFQDFIEGYYDYRALKTKKAQAFIRDKFCCNCFASEELNLKCNFYTGRWDSTNTDTVNGCDFTYLSMEGANRLAKQYAIENPKFDKWARKLYYFMNVRCSRGVDDMPSFKYKRKAHSYIDYNPVKDEVAFFSRTKKSVEILSMEKYFELFGVEIRSDPTRFDINEITNSYITAWVYHNHYAYDLRAVSMRTYASYRSNLVYNLTIERYSEIHTHSINSGHTTQQDGWGFQSRNIFHFIYALSPWGVSKYFNEGMKNLANKIKNKEPIKDVIDNLNSDKPVTLRLFEKGIKP